MKLLSDKSSIDNIILRCCLKESKHDSKISISQNSIYEVIKVNLFTINILSFNCFFSCNKIINKAYNVVKDLCNQIKEFIKQL